MSEHQPIPKVAEIAAPAHPSENLGSKEVLKNVTVIRLTQEDEAMLPEYVALIRQSILDIPQPKEVLEDILENQTIEKYTERLRDSNYFLYTARDTEGNLIGASYGVIRSKPGVSEQYKTVGHFGMTVVHPESRGLRIGGQLKDAFEQDCAKREIPKMTTFVYDTNRASIAMNQRMGMREITDDPVLAPQDGGRYYAKDTPPLKT